VSDGSPATRHAPQPVIVGRKRASEIAAARHDDVMVTAVTRSGDFTCAVTVAPILMATFAAFAMLSTVEQGGGK
jgi:hypothetical protein